MKTTPDIRKLIAAPAGSIITLQEFADYIKSDVDLIEYNPIAEAEKAAEHYCDRKFQEQTWELYYNCQPVCFRLPWGYTQELIEISTIAEDGTATVEDSGKYIADYPGDQLEVALKFGQSWTISYRPINKFRVKYKVGWKPEEMPPEIIRGVKEIAAFYYDNRSNVNYRDIRVDDMANARDALQSQKIWVF